MAHGRNIAGTKLGRYTLLKQLATGGTTEVLLARASGMHSFEHHVVIKRLTAQPHQDPQVLDMFLDEARVAASLHHHHIVQVHDIGREGEDYFFAMEYVHGEDLRKLLLRALRDGIPIPLDQIVTIVLAVAAALHHAHEQKAPDGKPLNIVHRDVSPANILVGYDGNVKVVDFGIAKAALRTSQTRSGTLRGKVAYMAPEQCMGKKIDRRSDVFALGIVLYELCTSRRLFKATTDFLTMNAVVNGKFPPPTKFRPDLPAGLEQIILEALAPPPDTRFQTAEEMGLALEAYAAAAGIRMSTTALADYMVKLFGTRPEPWLVDTDVLVESSDDEFDLEMPTALAPTVGNPRHQAAKTEPSGHPLADDPLDATTDEAGTELMDESALAAVLAEARAEQQAESELEDHSTVTGKVAPRDGFEAEEPTAIANDDASALLVEMSRIDGSGKPREATTSPRRALTPKPVPTPPAPTTLLGMPAAVPMHGPTATATVQSAPLPTPAGGWSAQPGPITGSPMEWAPQGSEVMSLAPRGRRVYVIIAVALPIVIAGILLLSTSSSDDEPAPAAIPDATPIDATLPIDAPLPDAAPPIDARSRAPRP
ncbi:MAG: serine/threonine protein kinase [Deltaproteobacteria bacterium]|nr:serine/threonine protein kinase [Deltaproteobacteria bacterium]